MKMLGTKPVFSSTCPMRSCRSGGSWSRAGTANLLIASVIATSLNEDHMEVVTRDSSRLPVSGVQQHPFDLGQRPQPIGSSTAAVTDAAVTTHRLAQARRTPCDATATARATIATTSV